MRKLTAVLLLVLSVASLGAAPGQYVCLRSMEMPASGCPVCQGDTPIGAGTVVFAGDGMCCAYVLTATRAAAVLSHTSILSDATSDVCDVAAPSFSAPRLDSRCTFAAAFPPHRRDPAVSVPLRL